MSTELTAFEGSALPSYMQQAISSGILDQTLVSRSSLDQLTFRGKVWRAIVNGEEHIQTNADGDPVSTIKVIILGKNPARSRAYYEGAFKEGENRAPACWSNNGSTPDRDVKEPVSNSCDTCPMAAKGSRVSQDGRPAIACTSFKNLVVIPANDLSFPALRLRLPQTSIWDKETEGQAWMAYDQYTNYLRSKSVPNEATIVTKIKFDPALAYPKLLFAADFDHDDKLKAYLTEKEFTAIAPRLKGEDFGVLLGTKALGTAAPATIAAPKIPVPSLDQLEKEEPPKAVKMKAETIVEEPKVKVAPAVAAGIDGLVDSWDD